MPAAIPTSLNGLTRIFDAKRIDCSRIGFYNEPRFIAAEQANPSFLDLYGAWTSLRERDTAYEARVRHLVPAITNIIAHEVGTDSQVGVCIDASMMLYKILEEQGIWSYCITGALEISSPSLPDTTNFWLYDRTLVAGHTWVVAPPFGVIDVTIKKQFYTRNEGRLLETPIMQEDVQRIVPSLRNYSPSSYRLNSQLESELQRIVDFFPTFEVRQRLANIRYFPGRVSVSDAPSLNSIKSRRWNGRLAGEIYREIVLPRLAGS